MKSKNNIPAILISAILSTVLNACGTLPNGEKWGSNATLLPGTARLSNAAYTAATNPSTWGPLAGAAVFAIGDLDDKVSEKAIEDNPVFGSVDDAADSSDEFRDALVATAVLSSLATPSGDDTSEWTANKLKGLVFTYGTLETTSLVTESIKNLSKRERPNKQNDKSFPSGHSSSAFAAATLSSRNLDSLALEEWQKTGIRIGLYSFATGTAWARVEGAKHYPSDVLAGAALGNFMANFLHDAFLGLNNDSVEISIETYPDYKLLLIGWRF